MSGDIVVFAYGMITMIILCLVPLFVIWFGDRFD